MKLKSVIRIIYIKEITLLFSPMVFIFDELSKINLNLSQVNVTCQGAVSPFQLLLNYLILR